MKFNFKKFSNITDLLTNYKKAASEYIDYDDFDELAGIGVEDENIQKILNDESGFEYDSNLGIDNQVIQKSDLWSPHLDDEMSMDDLLSKLDNFEKQEDEDMGIEKKKDEFTEKKKLPSYEEVLKLREDGLNPLSIARHFNNSKNNYDILNNKDISRILDSKIEPERNKWKYVYDEVKKMHDSGLTHYQIAKKLNVQEMAVTNLLKGNTQMLHGLSKNRPEFDYGTYILSEDNRNTLDPMSLAQKLGRYGSASAEVSSIMRKLSDPSVTSDQSGVLYEELVNSITADDIRQIVMGFANKKFKDKGSEVLEVFSKWDSTIFDKMEAGGDILDFIFGALNSIYLYKYKGKGNQ